MPKSCQLNPKNSQNFVEKGLRIFFGTRSLLGIVRVCVTSDRSELFAYDPIGNRVLDKNGNYVYDASSQRLKEDYQYFYNFDNNGNLISKIAKDVAADSYAYAYSSMNQLTSVKITQGISGPVKKEIQYNYDVLGRRMRRVVIDNQNSVNSNIRNFVNNGDNVFAEYDGRLLHRKLG